MFLVVCGCVSASYLYCATAVVAHSGKLVAAPWLDSSPVFALSVRSLEFSISRWKVVKFLWPCQTCLVNKLGVNFGPKNFRCFVSLWWCPLMLFNYDFRQVINVQICLVAMPSLGMLMPHTGAEGAAGRGGTEVFGVVAIKYATQYT